MPVQIPTFNNLNYNQAIAGGTQNALGAAQLMNNMQQLKLREQMAPIEIQAAQMQNQVASLNVLKQKLSLVTNPQSYAAMRNEAVTANPQLAQILPQKYDPIFMDKWNQQITNQLNLNQKQLAIQTGEYGLQSAKLKMGMLQDYMNQPQGNNNFSTSYRRDVLGNMLGIKNPALDAYVQQGIKGGLLPSGQLSPSAENIAQLIYHGQMAPPTGRAASSPQARIVMSRVREIGEENNAPYDAKLYKTRQAAIQAFNTGKQGDIVRSMNVGVQHLDLLDNLITSLANGDVHLINKARQHWKRATGYPAPTNFDTAKQIVADEITKAVIGGQTAEADRAELAHNLDRANSPAQLKQVVETLEGLMHGQLSGLRQQYIQSTGKTSQDFNKKLSPKTIEVLNRFNQNTAINQNVPTATNPQTGQKLYFRNGQWQSQ